MKDEIIPVENVGSLSKPDSPKEGLLSGVRLDNRTFVWMLMDVSFSMDESIRKNSGADLFEWEPQYMQQAQKLLISGQKAGNEQFRQYNPYEPDDVKQAVLDDCLSLPKPPSKESAEGLSSDSKLSIAKKAVSSFVRACFSKFPWFKIGVMAFDETVVDICSAAGADDTVRAVSDLETTGFTNIFNALSHMLDTVKKTRHPFGHRVIIVTDGLSQSCFQLPELVPDYKKIKLVCDAVFFYSEEEDPRERPDCKALIDFVKATGGEIQFVDSEKSFEQKFLKVAYKGLLGEGRKE